MNVISNGRLIAKASLAACMMIMAFAGSSVSGPIEDALTAVNRGEYATALPLLQSLAEKGDKRAQGLLGYFDFQSTLCVMYSEGQGGLRQDYVKAVNWCRRAADQGDADGQYVLGFMYVNGLAVPRDYAQAMRWFRMAASKGNGNAQWQLGAHYFLGQAVPRDYAQAMRWLRPAAEQGHAYAQLSLGLMYDIGADVSPDYVQAHKWYNLAASRFPPSEEKSRDLAVKNRDEIAAKMSPAQVAAARKLAREWKPRQ